MRTLKKVLLTILAMLPIASISTTAYCSLNEMAGEEQNDILRAQISLARKLLFQTGVLTTTYEEARERLAKQTGIQDQYELEEEFNRQIKILLDNGLIETQEIKMVSRTPSIW